MKVTQIRKLLNIRFYLLYIRLLGQYDSFSSTRRIWSSFFRSENPQPAQVQRRFTMADWNKLNGDHRRDPVVFLYLIFSLTKYENKPKTSAKYGTYALKKSSCHLYSVSDNEFVSHKLYDFPACKFARPTGFE